MATRPEGSNENEALDPGAIGWAVAVTAPATPGARQRAAAHQPSPQPRPDAPRILCVDDEPAMLKVLSRSLESEFEVITANDPMKALVLLEHGMDFAVVISDMKMPQMDGAEFLARVARIAPHCTRLALTACLERELSSDEAFGILTKPCPLNLLHASVRAAVEQHALQTMLTRGLARNAGQPVPPPVIHGASIPRRELQVPGIRASLQDPGQETELLVLPHLAFDPWAASATPDPDPSDTPRLSMLAGVAEKFFRLDNAPEAERILRPALWDLLMRCEADRRPSDREIELAGKLALRLAEDLQSPHWIDYVFRVYTSLSQPLSTDLIELLHDLIRAVPGTSRGAYQRYLSALRACRHEFGPGEHFLIRRIEGLQPLISP
ncbi:MAG TPA: response regulator [Polyangiaceae bacterium]|nr:response regulator [Polyangiaceae bacterium]